MKRLAMFAALLLIGCAGDPPPNTNDYFYRPATPLPRHYDLERELSQLQAQRTPPPVQQKVAPVEKPQEYFYTLPTDRPVQKYQETPQEPTIQRRRPSQVSPLSTASQWSHHLTQRYVPRNEGHRGYVNVYNTTVRQNIYQTVHTCRHIRSPINERRWQAPVYKPCFRGYDACGVPIYQQSLVSPGGWYTITTGYKCRRCGCSM